MGAQRFPAPAKLNLMLRVVGRRADGYHLLQTVFRFLDYGDELALTVRDDGAISRVPSPPDIPAEDDLTVRAARLAAGKDRCRRSALDIELVKRLPLGGGLGGGSSDAATALLALNQLVANGPDAGGAPGARAGAGGRRAGLRVRRERFRGRHRRAS